jgi:hypothetical protein
VTVHEGPSELYEKVFLDQDWWHIPGGFMLAHWCQDQKRFSYMWRPFPDAECQCGEPVPELLIIYMSTRTWP